MILCIALAFILCAGVIVGERELDLPVPAYPLPGPIPPAYVPPRWKSAGDAATPLPIWLVAQFINPHELERIVANEMDRVDWLRESIAAVGFERPFEINYDDRRVAFRDGHHRLLAAVQLGETHVPVILVPSAHVRGFGRPVRDLFEYLLLRRPEELAIPLPVERLLAEQRTYMSNHYSNGNERTSMT